MPVQQGVGRGPAGARRRPGRPHRRRDRHRHRRLRALAARRHAADGVLTSIDIETEHQKAARDAFGEAGIAPNRTRLISGPALEVLPRLTDGAYDLVLCDADKREYAEYLEQGVRLLRSGGVLAFDNALWHDRVADPAQRDESTTTIRELGKAVRDDPRLISAMLPCGDGLLAAVKR